MITETLYFFDFPDKKPSQEQFDKLFLLECDPLFGPAFELAYWNEATEDFSDFHGDVVESRFIWKWAVLPSKVAENS